MLSAGRFDWHGGQYLSLPGPCRLPAGHTPVPAWLSPYSRYFRMPPRLDCFQLERQIRRRRSLPSWTRQGLPQRGVRAVGRATGWIVPQVRGRWNAGGLPNRFFLPSATRFSPRWSLRS